MIYFIQDSLTFRIKIGYTAKENVKERLAQLQTGSSSLLYLLACREGGPEIEGHLHKQFAEYRTQGEWFNPGPELLHYIVGCAAFKVAKEALATAVAEQMVDGYPETEGEKQRRTEAEAKVKEEKRREMEQELLESRMQTAAQVLSKYPQLRVERYRSGDGGYFIPNLTPTSVGEVAFTWASRVKNELIGLILESDGEPRSPWGSVR